MYMILITVAESDLMKMVNQQVIYRESVKAILR